MCRDGCKARRLAPQTHPSCPKRQCCLHARPDQALKRSPNACPFPQWGQAGYIYLKYGVNLCQLASDATYAKGAKAV